MTERERITGKLSHADCNCPCHFKQAITISTFPAASNCYCGYDGRDEGPRRDTYFGTAGQRVGSVPQEFRIYNGTAMPGESSRVNFYSPMPDGMPSSHRVATVWTDSSGHLHVRMDMDNVFDVIFEATDALRPRNIQFKNREQ